MVWVGLDDAHLEACVTDSPALHHDRLVPNSTGDNHHEDVLRVVREAEVSGVAMSRISRERTYGERAVRPIACQRMVAISIELASYDAW